MMVRKSLLACGVLAFVLYLAMDVGAARRYEGYSYESQTISELSAVDAPTRSQWIVLGMVYSVLVIASGLGVWASAGGKHALRVVGGLLVGGGIMGFAWPFAPVHQREDLAAGGSTWQDTMHIVLGAVTSLLYMLMIGFGAAALGKQFRLYSIATFVVVLVFGILAGLESPKIADNEPTPWIGVTERIAVFGPMLWIAVLSIALLRSQSTVSPDKGKLLESLPRQASSYTLVQSS